MPPARARRPSARKTPGTPLPAPTNHQQLTTIRVPRGVAENAFDEVGEKWFLIGWGQTLRAPSFGARGVR